MVEDLKALNSYSRSGHSVMMGRVTHDLTPSAVSKLVSRGRLETKSKEIAKELPESQLIFSQATISEGHSLSV